MANVVAVFLVLVSLSTCALWTQEAEAVKLLFSETDGAVSIKNCSNCLFTIECNDLTCQCSDVSAGDVEQAASAAENVTWWYGEDVEICCGSLTSAAAQKVLFELLDFSYMTQVELKQCHELATSDTEQWLTIFGLRELYMTASRTATYTSKTFDLQSADDDHTDQSQEYRDHHIAFVARNILDGEVDMRSWSLVGEVGGAGLSQRVAAAVARSPAVVRSKSDGTFMWTPIYGV